MTADELLALTLDEVTEGPTDELAARLRDAMAITAQTKDIIDALTLELNDRLETDQQVVRGIGLLRREKVKASNWRDRGSSSQFRRDVGEAVVADVSRDIATGEFDPVKRNIARVTVKRLYDVIPAFSSIKAAGYDLGLNMEDYRTTRETTRVVLDTEGTW